jgi:hypothetical protein
MSDRPHSGLPHATYERFDSSLELEAMFDELIRETQRVIRIFDRALSPRYDAPERCELLRQFLRADRLNELLIVVHEAENIPRALPRFTSLLQQFSHSAHVRQTPASARHIYDPFAVFDATHYLHRFHHAHMRFARGRNDVAGAQTLLDRHKELWDVSMPAAPTTTLGL